MESPKCPVVPDQRIAAGQIPKTSTQHESALCANTNPGNDNNAVERQHQMPENIPRESVLLKIGKIDDVSRPRWFKLLPVPRQLSLWPLREVMRLIKGAPLFMNPKVRKAKTPIFRVHAGLNSVVLADHASGSFFLSAGSDVFDREHQARFGPLGVPKKLILGNDNPRPALLCNDENNHAKTRRLSAEIFKLRLEDTHGCFDRSMNLSADIFDFKFRQNIKSLSVHEVGFTIAAQFQFEWLLGFEAPLLQDLISWIGRAGSHLQFDSYLSTALFRVAEPFLVPSKETKRITNLFLEKVRSSQYFEEYCNLAKGLDMPTEDLDRFLLYTTGYNGTLGHGLFLASVIGTLSSNLGCWESLKDELDGHNDLNLDTIDGFPLLDSFMWECLRCYIRPSLIYKRAKKDVLIPASDGYHYPVKKGELVMAWMPSIMRDPAVFEHANGFNSRRFLKNPELKSKVHAFGFVSNQSGPSIPPNESKFGCAYRLSGVAEQINKLYIARLIQTFDWTLETPAITGYPYLGEVGPKDLKFSSFRLRK